MSSEIFVEKICEEAVLPFYAHEGDAGMDLCSIDEYTIAPGQTILVHTGLKFAIPQGLEVQIRPRSGISLNTPLRIPNAPGTIDSGYRGEICVIMENTSPDNYSASAEKTLSDKGNQKGPYRIRKGDRIAQMVVARYETAVFQETDSVETIGSDRQGGFGSTGVRS